VTLAVIIIVLLALQALFHQAHFRGECMKPKQCGSIGGLLMGFSLCCSYLRFVDGSGDSAFIMVHFAAALQTVMVLYYFFWTNKMKSPPVPYWFPATVGIGMSGIAGSKVGMDPVLQQVFFWVSAVLCAVEWPWITMRCLHTERIAPAPSIFVHGAPVSLVSLAFMEVFVTPMGENITPAAIGAAHFFFLGTELAAVVTLFFAYQRREILYRFIRPMKEVWVHQEWAGLTFPLVATSCYAVLYASRIVPLSGNETAINAANVWATILGVFTLVLVGGINFFYFVFGLPQWIWRGLPMVPAPGALAPEELQQTGEKMCCKCWPVFGGKVQNTRTATNEKARPAFVHRQGSMYGVMPPGTIPRQGSMYAVGTDVSDGAAAHETELKKHLEVPRTDPTPSPESVPEEGSTSVPESSIDVAVR